MYKVEVLNDGGSAFMAKTKDCEFVIDTNGSGVTPPDALLASLGSCVGVYIRKYADGAKINVGNFKVTVESDLGKEAPFRFKTIKVNVELGTLALDDRRKKALLDFIKNCPVHNTLKSAPAVDIVIA